MNQAQFMLSVFAPAPPPRWVYPEVAAVASDMPPEGWPRSLFCEVTGQWVEFADLAELRAATLEDERLPLPERSPWIGGSG